MATGGDVAQAEVGAYWRVQGEKVFSLTPELKVTLENKDGSLLFTTKGGTKVEILCTAIELYAGVLRSIELEHDGWIGYNSKVKFSGCKTKLNGTESKHCTPKTEYTPEGTIETSELKGELALHWNFFGESIPIVRFQPYTGEKLVVIQLGELCAIEETMSINGQLTLRDYELGKEATTHLVVLGPLTFLTALGQPASIDGSASVSLAGWHEGLKFSGVPN
jgi:hypothetical protein